MAPRLFIAALACLVTLGSIRAEDNDTPTKAAARAYLQVQKESAALVQAEVDRMNREIEGIVRVHSKSWADRVETLRKAKINRTEPDGITTFRSTTDKSKAIRAAIDRAKAAGTVAEQIKKDGIAKVPDADLLAVDVSVPGSADGGFGDVLDSDDLKPTKAPEPDGTIKRLLEERAEAAASTGGTALTVRKGVVAGFGPIRGKFKVLEVIDEENCRVDIAVGDGESVDLWMRGQSTKGMFDGAILASDSLFVHFGTESYATVSGTKRTVPVIVRVDPKAVLKEVELLKASPKP